MLRPVLTTENYLAVLTEARRRSKTESERSRLPLRSLAQHSWNRIILSLPRRFRHRRRRAPSSRFPGILAVPERRRASGGTMMAAALASGDAAAS